MGRTFGIGLTEYKNYKRVHGQRVGLDTATMIAGLATCRYRTIKALGIEAFSFPSVRVQELLLVDEVIDIGRSIQTQREIDTAKWSSD